MAKKILKSFDELKDWAMRTLHDALLRGGAPEMRSALHMVLVHTLAWAEQERVLSKRARRKK